jgi:exopolysaccharide biosynthesis polyprenyl glycosylphosphotransferase
MHTAKRQFLLTCLKISDIAVMLMALAASLWYWEFLHSHVSSVGDFLQIKTKLTNFVALLVFIPVYHMILRIMGLYDSRRLLAGKGEWKDICKAVLLGTGTLLLIVLVFQRAHVSREVILLFAVLSCGLTGVSRFLMRIVLGWVRRQNRNLRNILLVGCNHRASEFARHLTAKPQLGYRIVGFIDDLSSTEGYSRYGLALKHLGTLQDFNAVVDRIAIDEVFIALPIRSFYEQMNQIIEACETQGIEVHLLSNFFSLKIAKARIAEFEGIPILTLKTRPFSTWEPYMKRGFDLIVASSLMLILLPVFVVVALSIKILSPEGPIFFVQTRVGYNRRLFKMFKFRTMVPNAEVLQSELESLNEAQGPAFKIKNDPRITPIGRILRKTSLDELPQLLNVIKGDMSLVGPRPLPLRDVARFAEDWLKRRFSVKPGITCLWQINGRSNSTFDEWIKQDLEYIDCWSFGLDLKILAKTIPAVLRGEGAH